MKHSKHDEIVALVRADLTVGRYTCSVIDETFTDIELVETFGWTDAGRERTPLGALRRARGFHDVWVDMFNDRRGDI